MPNNIESPDPDRSNFPSRKSVAGEVRPAWLGWMITLLIWGAGLAGAAVLGVAMVVAVALAVA